MSSPCIPKKEVCKKMRSYNRENLIFHGNYLDVNVFPVFTDGRLRGKRRKKAKPTSEVQQALNKKYAKNKNAYLINHNFTPSDLVIHPTYDDYALPTSAEEAIRDMKNYLRRIKRALQKEGKELKYFAVYEQSKTSRHHLHIIISGGLTYLQIQNLWGYGIVEISPLYFNEYGVEGLTNYITKETSGKKKIMHSRNLINPPKKQRDGKISRVKLKELCNYDIDIKDFCRKNYPGYELADMKPFYNDVNGNYYITFRLYKPEIFKKRRCRNGSPTGQPAA